MKAEAVPLGSKLIAQETELDKLFVSLSITPASLKASTAAIAVTQGELREVHVKYHLFAADILSSDQIKRYAELRGYTAGKTGDVHHHPERMGPLRLTADEPQGAGDGSDLSHPRRRGADRALWPG